MHDELLIHRCLDGGLTAEESAELSECILSSPEARRRYWEVAGFAQVPCGGTHLKTTGEVGELAMKRKNIGQGKERIEIYLY